VHCIIIEIQKQVVVCHCTELARAKSCLGNYEAGCMLKRPGFSHAFLVRIAVFTLAAYLALWNHFSSLPSLFQTTAHPFWDGLLQHADGANLSSPSKTASMWGHVASLANISSAFRKAFLWGDKILVATADNMSTSTAFWRTPTSKLQTLTEAYVLSFDPRKVKIFTQRNYLTSNSSADQVLWYPGVDGYHQPTLNLWAKLSGQPAMNLTEFAGRNKAEYRSPHAVGCYLAHWHLMRTFQHKL
jgi:hypothetical protein